MAGRTATIRCLRLAEFAKHSVDRVERRVDLLTDLSSRRGRDK